MGVSLRIGAWLLATIAVIAATLNFFFFWKLAPGASAVLPASVALAGTLIGAALTIELQLYSGGIEYSRKIQMTQLESAQRIHLYELDREQQMRLAALDKRLHVHQEAYDILQGYHDERYVRALVEYCSDAERKLIDDVEYSSSLFLELSERWYSKNCLYLDREVDVKFRAALHGECSYESVQALIRTAVYLPGMTVDNVKDASQQNMQWMAG